MDSRSLGFLYFSHANIEFYYFFNAKKHLLQVSICYTSTSFFPLWSLNRNNQAWQLMSMFKILEAKAILKNPLKSSTVGQLNSNQWYIYCLMWPQDNSFWQFSSCPSFNDLSGENDIIFLKCNKSYNWFLTDM